MIHELSCLIREWVAGFLLNLSMRIMTDEMLEDWGPYLMAATQKAQARYRQELQNLEKR